VYCLKVPFLKPVKCNNFLPYNLSLCNCAPERARVTLKKKRFALKRACCGEEEEMLLLPWCSKYNCKTPE